MVATSSGDLAKRVRKFIFDHFVEHATPPVLEQIMRQFGLDRLQAFGILQDLERARHLRLVPGTQRVLMAFPFSALATPFRVSRSDGHSYFANCAWDAIAFHAMLGEPIQVDSHCHHCAQDIHIRIADGGLAAANPKEPLVFISLPAIRWWDDILNTCSNHMAFFASQEHLDDWRVASSLAGGEALTVWQTHALGLPIYREKMSLEYARPSKEQLNTHFASLGLTSEFWRL